MEFLSRNPDIVQIHQAFYPQKETLSTGELMSCKAGSMQALWFGIISSKTGFHDDFEQPDESLTGRALNIVEVLGDPQSVHATYQDAQVVHYLPGGDFQNNVML